MGNQWMALIRKLNVFEYFFPMGPSIKDVVLLYEGTEVSNFDVVRSQLRGRLFSPSDKCKKLSHHFLLHFLIGMGS